MPKNWTPEEHAKLLVALIKTGKPKVDTAQIAAYLNNGRTAVAVYFEIRRLKLLAEGRRGPVKKRARDSEAPPSDLATPVKAEPRPIRAKRPSEAKRSFDEIADSGFWDESDEERPQTTAKRAKTRVKFEDDLEFSGNVSEH